MEPPGPPAGDGRLAAGPADETLRFGLGGTDHEIDLSKKNASRFRRQVAPCIDHALLLCQAAWLSGAVALSARSIR
jgi:hypothetical protein